jgi:hypothetical protein
MRSLQVMPIDTAAAGGDYTHDQPIVPREYAMGAAIRAAAHLGFLIGPVFQLGCALINPAFWMECLNHKHGVLSIASSQSSHL